MASAPTAPAREADQRSGAIPQMRESGWRERASVGGGASWSGRRPCSGGDAARPRGLSRRVGLGAPRRPAATARRWMRSRLTRRGIGVEHLELEAVGPAISSPRDGTRPASVTIRPPSGVDILRRPRRREVDAERLRDLLEAGAAHRR